MAVRVFISTKLQNHPNIKKLASDFKTYKSEQKSHFNDFKFGKDCSYNRPQSIVDAEVDHVHLVPIHNQGNTSDRFLVYTRGFTDSDAFLIIAILEPNAHELSRNVLNMLHLADIAEKFRNQF